MWEKEKMMVWHSYGENSILNFITHSRPRRGRLSKALWEKEKMLVTSIFSFSQNVFYLNEDRNHNFRNIITVVCKHFESGSVRGCRLVTFILPFTSIDIFSGECRADQPTYMCSLICLFAVLSHVS